MNWRKSPYPFKSPHWRNRFGYVFNDICKAIGDPARVPAGKSARKKNAPGNLAFSEQVVGKIEEFAQLGDYTALDAVAGALPLHYLFILPARPAIVIFAAYTSLLPHEPGKLPAYETLQKYVGIEEEGWGVRGSYTDYYFYWFVTDYLKLYSLSKPFRCLLGLPVATSPRYPAGNRRAERLEKMKGAGGAVRAITGANPLWETVSSPGRILVLVHNLLTTQGFDAALQFVRYLFRASGLTRSLLLSEEIPDDYAEKIWGLTERYLTKDAVLRFLGRGDKSLSQSSVDDWIK